MCEIIGWHTPKAGGRFDKFNLVQSGRAMARTEIEMSSAHSPEARDCCERQSAIYHGGLSRGPAAQGNIAMETEKPC